MSRNVNNDGESVSKSPEDTNRENTSSPIFKVITSKFRGMISIKNMSGIICFKQYHMSKDFLMTILIT